MGGQQVEELVWIQDPHGKLHYGKLTDEDREGTKSIIKYVGDPVFGFLPTQKKVEVIRIIDRGVEMKGTFCRNPILLLGSAGAGKTSFCEMLVNHHFPRKHEKTYCATPYILASTFKSMEKDRFSVKHINIKLVDTVGTMDSVVSRESDDYRMISLYSRKGQFGVVDSSWNILHGPKAIIAIVDMTSCSSLKKAFNLLRILRNIERRTKERDPLPVVVMANKEDLVLSLTGPSKAELMRGMTLLVEETRKRELHGILYHGSVKNNSIGYFNFDGPESTGAFVARLYNSAHLVDGSLSRAESRRESLSAILQLLTNRYDLNWDNLRYTRGRGAALTVSKTGGKAGASSTADSNGESGAMPRSKPGENARDGGLCGIGGGGCVVS